MSATYAIFRKELADHLTNKRFLLILAMILVLSTASSYQATNFLKESTSTTANFLSIFSEGVNGSSFVYMMVLFGPLLGLSLSFDAINKERKSGTLSTVLTQPIFRDAIINGKFLAGAAVISAAILVTLCINMGIAIPLLGFGPTSVQATAIVILAIVTIVYLCFWYGLGLLFSVAFRNTSTSILTSIGTWVVFSILIFILAGFVADISVPAVTFNPGNFTGTSGFRGAGGNFSQIITTASGVTNSRTAITNSISQISPAYLYSDIASKITGASSASFTGFSISIPTFRGQTYDLMSALGASWAQILIIVIAMAVCFAASYIFFMRSEIRPQS
jgi:ABC-2 type transport system permease protein